MHNSIVCGVKNIFRQSRGDISLASRVRTYCIYAICCRAASDIRTSTPLPQHRPFLYAPRPRRQESTASARQAHQDSGVPQTHYDLFPLTFPDGPPPRSPFSPDLKKLRKEFLQLQTKSHPDTARAGRKRQAEALSSLINEAYKTLQDPLRRAQHLLSLSGIDVEDESAKLSESELLMEVMEAREAVEDAENHEELSALRADNDRRIADSVKTLGEAFAESHLDRAVKETIRLRYWKNIEESIQGWEKGSGGGMNHH